MTIKEGKTRVIATIPQELKDKLDIMCKHDKRNISQELEYILEKYISDYNDIYPSFVEVIEDYPF